MNKTIFYINVDGAVYREGRYLIIRRGWNEPHAAGMLSVPGGKVENAGECEHILEATVRREVLEETGIEVDEQVVYLNSNAFISDDGRDFVSVDFLCFYKSGEARIDDAGEVASLSWMEPGEILNDPACPPYTRLTIELAEAARQKISPTESL